MVWSTGSVVDFRAPLNDRQFEILRWIGQGCPEGVMEGHLHKRIAVALQDRRLVKISKKGGSWRAVATDAGRHYIDRGDYPNGFWITPKPPAIPSHPSAVPREGPRSKAPTKRESEDSPSESEVAPALASPPQPAPRAKRLPVTEQLIADVISAGGELRVNTAEDKVNYDQRVAAAIRHGKVPEGKLLVIERGTSWQQRIIRLQEPPEWMTVALTPILVPATLRKPHGLVTALKDDDDLLRLTVQVRGRAFRLIQALTVEAERRGYTVRHDARAGGSRRHHEPAEGLFTVKISGHELGIDLQQQHDRIEHVPTVSELRHAERDSWYRIPSHDDKPSSRLTISVTNGRQYRQSTWSDGTKTQLEECLPQVLQELELRAGFAEEQHLEEERKRAKEQRLWEEAMERAKADFRENHHAKVLKKQLDQWQTVQALDAYLAAMRMKVKTLDDESQKESAQAWLTWAEEYRKKIDPLSVPPTMPKTPEPRSDDLEPFLGGWSAYGPRRGRW